jgi:hypothetical protein
MGSMGDRTTVGVRVAGGTTQDMAPAVNVWVGKGRELRKNPTGGLIAVSN